jgi:hypothetical protein
MSIKPEYEALYAVFRVTEWRDDHGVRAVYKTEFVEERWVPMEHKRDGGSLLGTSFEKDGETYVFAAPSIETLTRFAGQVTRLRR